MNESTIKFTTEDNEVIEFEIIEQAKINGTNYILVTEAGNDDEEADAFIMKEVNEDKGQATYEFVEEDNELNVVSDYFNGLLEEIDVKYDGDN